MVVERKVIQADQAIGLLVVGLRYDRTRREIALNPKKSCCKSDCNKMKLHTSRTLPFKKEACLKKVHVVRKSKPKSRVESSRVVATVAIAKCVFVDRNEPS